MADISERWSFPFDFSFLHISSSTKIFFQYRNTDFIFTKSELCLPIVMKIMVALCNAAIVYDCFAKIMVTSSGLLVFTLKSLSVTKTNSY